MKTKILIIKLGYSETLDSEISKVPSLGDILRTTPVLWALKEKYPNSHITWIIADEAEQLLQGNKLIDRILGWNEFLPFQLMREKFDILINLEKIPGVCALSDMIDAWKKYGFRFDSLRGTYHAYEGGMSFIKYIKAKQKKLKNNDFWQKVLIEMLGVEWKGQDYILGYKPKTKSAYDIGLNYEVGTKWPTKAMQKEKWEQMNKVFLDLGFKVSWQEGLTDLYEYMDWINSCEIIVTHDSLGLHLALAFKKKVIGLFGPTDQREIYVSNNSRMIVSKEKCKYMPCFSQKCITGLDCINKIDIDRVVKAVLSLKNEP